MKQLTGLISFQSKPQQIFLVDATGALITSGLLFLIYFRFAEVFGVPREIFLYLSVIAFLYSIYSFSCHLIKPINGWFFLRWIIFANIFYCCLTITVMIIFRNQLTLVGMSYFLIEIMVICALVLVEIKIWKILKKLKNSF